MAADVPVKTYLSGGIDSTAISVVSRGVDPEMTAYSCIFDLDDVGDDRQVDEREFSRLVARETDMRRVEVQLGPESLQESLDDYVSSLEDLRMGMGYPVYHMARRVAQDAKVVLSGTGGDEFHAGYVGRFQVLGLPCVPAAPLWRRIARRWKARLKRWLGRTPPAPPATNPAQIYRNVLNCFVRPEKWKDTFTPEFVRAAGGFDVEAAMSGFILRCPSDDWRDRVLYVDAKTYLAGLLAFEDKVSMAHSLETRVPLLDNELVDFVNDVPFDKLWQGAVGKVLFRESVRPLVPEQIYNKPKMGFSPPDASWYRGRLRPWIEQRLAPHLNGERGVFLPSYVRGVLDDHFSGRINVYHLIWTLLNFETWCRVFGQYGAAASGVAKVA
jgi:asparagine synthase (glutamine-hydrolysing)